MNTLDGGVAGGKLSTTEALRVTRDLALEVGQAQSLDHALGVVLRSVCEATGWGLGQAWVPAPDGSHLRCSPAWHARSEAFGSFRAESAAKTFPPGIGLPGRVWSSERPAWIDDVTVDRNFPRSPAARLTGLVAGMAVPALARGKVVAVLEFFVVEARDEDALLLDFVSTLAAQIGTLIQARASEEAVRESEARFRSLTETATDAIVAANDRGTITYFNEAAQRIFGYSVDEALGQSLTLLMPQRFIAAHREGFSRHLSTGERRVIGKTVEVIGSRKDGSEFPIELSIGAWRSREERFFTGIMRDVSERHRVEAERAALEAQLRQGQKMKAIGSLAGGVAHDFNNLLSVILNYARFLADDLGPNDPRRGDVDEVIRAGERGAGLVRQLLALSRKDIVAPVAVDLNEVVTQMTVMLNRTLEEHVHLSTNLAPDLKPTLADVGQVEQILLNLAVNARDAMREGGNLMIETSNEWVDDAYAKQSPGLSTGDYVCLAVSDTGQGMTDKIRARVFEPFFTTKERGAGTGLGLATVYGIVKQWQGYIRAESQVGRGTTFKVYLPASETAEVDVGRMRAPGSTHEGMETILVVEDEDSVREMVRRILSRGGYKVLLARSADEAMEVLDTETIDLLLTDMIMPGLSGKELGSLARSLVPGLGIVYMSGYTDEIIAKHGPFSEDEILVQKPFSPDELLLKLRQALNDGRATPNLIES